MSAPLTLMRGYPPEISTRVTSVGLVYVLRPAHRVPLKAPPADEKRPSWFAEWDELILGRVTNVRVTVRMVDAQLWCVEVSQLDIAPTRTPSAAYVLLTLVATLLAVQGVQTNNPVMIGASMLLMGLYLYRLINHWFRRT